MFIMRAFEVVLVGLCASAYAQVTGVNPIATPNGPSSVFDPTPATTTPHATIIGILPSPSIPTPSVVTSCFEVVTTATLSGGVALVTDAPLDSFGDLPDGAECDFWYIDPSLSVSFVLSRSTVGVAAEATSSSPASSEGASSTSSSLAKGAIAGVVIGCVFGSLLIGATILAIRRMRRSGNASGAWFHRRPANWVAPEQEKKPGYDFEMTPRSPA